jgi:hypothetical protein
LPATTGTIVREALSWGAASLVSSISASSWKKDLHQDKDIAGV